MMRQSSRNQRSKNLKIKHVLQLLVLLAISIWLLYQLKHTYDKKYAVNSTTNNPDENPITTNDQILPQKTTKLGRKDLPQNIESHKSEGDKENEVDEEDEEKDIELEQLLEDVEVRETGQEDAEENGEDRDDEIADGEYGTNGEEDEEGNTDGDANDMEGKGTLPLPLPSVNASISVESDSVSNQTGSVNLSINQEKNSTAHVEIKEEVGKSGVQDELQAIEVSLVEAANETSTDAPPYLSTKVDGKRDGIKEE
ncbi:uncharacterized protein LOC144574161 [Carex rostrata]